MKSLLIAASLIFSQISFSAQNAPAQKQYDLKMELSINGKHISSPHTVVIEGEPATVTQDTKDGKFFLTVATMKVPNETKIKNPEKKKALGFQFAVGKIGADGKETLLADLPSSLSKEKPQQSRSVMIKQKKLCR